MNKYEIKKYLYEQLIVDEIAKNSLWGCTLESGTLIDRQCWDRRVRLRNILSKLRGE